MKIAFINGSPKIKDSASSYILQELKVFLKDESNMISEYYFRKSQLSTKEIEQLTEYNILVFAFPLYVDGIPSHLLNCLMQLEKPFANIKEKNIMVCSLVNCGFYEGLHINLLQKWDGESLLKQMD